MVLIEGNRDRTARCTRTALGCSPRSTFCQLVGIPAGWVVDRYLAVTQRTALRKTIWARPFWVAPVTESRAPFLTSATVRASGPEVVRMSRSAVATRGPITAGSPVREPARDWIATQPPD